MDRDLDEFEKSLAAEKAERERDEEKKQRKHRHHHHRRDRSTERDRDGSGHRHRHHHRHRDDRDDEDDDGHRHKRSRHSKDNDGHHGDREHSRREHRDRDHERDSERRPHAKTSDEEVAAEDFEKPASSSNTLVRDSWMTDPSAIDIDYVHRGAKQSKTEPPPKQQPKRDIHAREINAAELQALNDGKSLDELDMPAQHDVDYKFGDSGSQWRMTKLNGVYRTAEESGRSVEEVAEERYGGLREFDDAREEKIELDRRKVYGEGYVGKEKPSGELFQERKLDMGIHEKRGAASSITEQTEQLAQGTVIPDPHTTTQIDQTTLNRLRARMMKAKLKKSPDVAKLEAEYNEAAAAYKAQGPSSSSAVVLNVMENRMLAGSSRAEAKAINTKRGRERGLVEENDEMSIEDMVREERRTRGHGQGQGGDGLRIAERIAKDAKFDNDLEYMDENAEKLARRVQKSELSLKNTAVGEFQKINRILDACPLCFHEDETSKSETQQQPIAPVVSLGTRAYLTLPTEPTLADGGAVIVPLQHRTNLLECDDDEWEELRNFMKCLTRMYHAQGREVVFYENAARRSRRPHAAMQAVPIPWDLGATAPAFFREAMLAADEEWAQHRKVIDTGARAGRDGRLAFRRAIAREAPYFHVWFSLDGGLAHVVEDEGRWPAGDLFAREVLGGMLDVMPDVVKKQGRWSRRGGDDAKRVEEFRRRWRMFDWTRVLTEGQQA